MRLLAAVSAFVFATALNAGPLPVTDERPVSPITPAAAASYQSDPSIAVDSAGHVVAIWRDQRLLSAACTQCPAIYGSRLDASGQPLDRLGKRLITGASFAEIASAGSDFLVVYGGAEGLWSQRFDAGLQPIGSPVQVSPSGRYITALASNGQTYLALVQNETRPQALILDTTGRVVASSNFSAPSLAAFALPRIVVSGSQYHVLRENSGCPTTCSSWVEDAIVDEHAAITSRVLESAASQWFQIGAAASGQGLLVAWAADDPTTGKQTIDYELFRNDGTASGRKTAYTLDVSSASAGNKPVVLWDGRQFALLFQVGGGSQMVGMRIGADGTAIDATPHVVFNSNPPSFYPQGISSARLPNGSNVVVWSNGSDVWDVAVRSTDEIFNLAGQLVTWSGTEQRDLQVSGASATWIESTSNQASIVATINGSAPVTVVPADSVWFRQSPAIASAGGVTMVAWMESATRQRIYARRYDASGALLDLTPILIADEPQTYGSVLYLHRALSIASDGAHFLVSWPSGSEVHARRFNADGSPMDAAPIVVAKFNPDTDSPYVTRTVWTGSQWIVATTRTRTWGVLISPAPFDDSIYLARVAAEGVAIDANAPTLVFDAGWNSAPVSAAFTSGRLMLAWRRVEVTGSTPSASVWAQLFDADGRSIQPSAQPVISGTSAMLLDTDVTALGGSFLVGTSERGSDGHYVIRGRLFDVDGTAVADAFDLSPAGADATTLSLGENGVGYTRVATEAGEIMRAFTRSIIVPSRRRAAAR